MWRVIRGFDDAVGKMNACFSNILYELQKDEIKKKERAERRLRMAEQRKQDLLKGNPF